MNPQIVTVNLIPGLSTPAVVRVSQYDVERPITLRVLDGNKAAVFPDACTATIEGTKPSGLGFSLLGTIAPGGMVSFTTGVTMTQECGMIPTEIRFSTNAYGSFPATDIGTANFILAIEPSPHPEGTTDGTQETMGDLQSQLNALDTRVDALEAGGGGSGLTDDIKTALLNCFAHVAWVDADGQDYYDALESALDSGDLSVSLMLSQVSSSNTATTVGYGESYNTTLTASTGYTLNTVTVTMGGVDVTSTTYSSGTVSIPSVTGNITITATAVLAAQSITATYTQSGTVYDTDSLDSLKTDLVVTANYAGGTSETVPASAYTLSGTLTVGTSTITVTYAGLTTTFNVTVSEVGPPSEYTAHDYLKYIGGTGTRGIITPAQIKSEYTVEFDMYIPTQSGAYGSVSSVFGTRTAASGTKEIAIFVTGSSGKIGYWYNGTDTTTNITTTKDAVHHFKILPVGSSEDYPLNAVIDIDGTEYSTGSTASGVTWSAWFGIMGYGTSASTVTSSGSTYYQLGDIVVKDANGDTVYWFMPVSKGTQVGFYDIVGQAFYEADSAVYQAGDWT